MNYAFAHQAYFVEVASQAKTVDFAYSAQHSVYIKQFLPDVRFVRPLAGLIVEWAEARSQPAAHCRSLPRSAMSGSLPSCF